MFLWKKYGELFLNCPWYPFLTGALGRLSLKDFMEYIFTTMLFLCFSLTKGSNFSDFLCASLDDKALQEKELLLIKEFAPLGSEFFHLREALNEV